MHLAWAGLPAQRSVESETAFELHATPRCSPPMPPNKSVSTQETRSQHNQYHGGEDGVRKAAWGLVPLSENRQENQSPQSRSVSAKKGVQYWKAEMH